MLRAFEIWLLMSVVTGISISRWNANAAQSTPLIWPSTRPRPRIEALATRFRIGEFTLGQFFRNPQVYGLHFLRLALLLPRRLKLISALNIISAAELCPSGLAVGVINVCLLRSRAAGDK